jgi:anti-anti-sigma factor
MEVSVTFDGVNTVVALAGELDAMTAAQLRQIVVPLIGGDAGGIVIDVVGLSFLGTRGAQTIVDLHRLASQAGQSLVVKGFTRKSLRAMRLVDVDGEVPGD